MLLILVAKFKWPIANGKILVGSNLRQKLRTKFERQNTLPVWVGMGVRISVGYCQVATVVQPVKIGGFKQVQMYDWLKYTFNILYIYLLDQSKNVKFSSKNFFVKLHQ